MARTTALLRKTAPAAADALTVSTGAATWQYGAWVPFIASTAAAIQIDELVVHQVGGSVSVQCEIEIGIGAAGFEAGVGGHFRFHWQNSGSDSWPNILPLPSPVSVIPVGSRVSLRARHRGGGPAAYKFAFTYFESLDADNAHTGTLGSLPAGADGADVTGHATPWTPSTWVLLDAALAASRDLYGLAWNVASGPTFVDIEWQVGTGTLGSQTVVTTLRTSKLTNNSGGLHHAVLPAVCPLAAGSAVWVRCRKGGTSTAALSVALLTYTPSLAVEPPEPTVPPNTIIVWIDGLNRTPMVSGLRWSKTINGIGTATFMVRDPTGVYIPQDDQLVEIEVAGTIRWAGTIANPAGTSHLVHRGVGTACSVTCQDHNQKLQRSISNGIFPAQSLHAMLTYLCTGVLVPQAITLDPTQENPGPALTTITSPWLTSEALVDYLATQTGYVRRVDEDSQLKMWAVGSASSGVTLSAANANVRAAAYDLQRFDYRSAQWVVFGPNGVLRVGDSWTGDGTTQVFPQHYRNYPGPPSTVTVGASTLPVGTYGVDVMEWTWRQSDFSLVHAGTPVGAGVPISTDYDTLFPSFVYTEGDEWVTRPWVRVDFAPHILHWDEALSYAEALIRQHQPRLKLPQVTTYVETIGPGETVIVDFPVLGIDALTCLVRATETRVIPTGAEVLLETALDLIGGTEDVPANSATDLWKRIIFGESATSSGAVGSTSGGLGPGTGSPDAGGPHALLSTTHSDAVPATVVRGDLLAGTSTPKWARLPVGPAQSVLQANGTDAAWTPTPTVSALQVKQLTTAAGPNIGLDAALLDGSGYLGSLLFSLLTGAIAEIRAKEHTADNYGLSFLTGSPAGVTEKLRIAGGGTVTVGQAGTPGALVVNGPTTLDDATVTGNFRCAMLTNDTGLAAGTYTPTLTGVVNVSSVTAFQTMYQRVGLIVTVSGLLSVDPITGSSNSEIGISLPIASGLYASEQVAGIASSNASNEPGAIYADYTNDRAHLVIPSANAAAHLVMFSFMYQVF